MTQPVVLLLSRPGDPAAEVLARRPGIKLVTVVPRDLSRSGWHYASDRPGSARAAVADGVIAARDIAFVICRLGGVTANDLPHIAAADRRYCAEEMNAFLLGWLHQFEGLVANPARPNALGGSRWGALAWRQAAAACGAAIPVRARRRGPLSPSASEGRAVPPPHAIVPVVAGRAVGDSPAMIGAIAERLAERARLPLLEVRFEYHGGAWEFAAADPFPALRPEFVDALLVLAADPVARTVWRA